MPGVADVVLRIGSQLGPGGFSSLQSMIQMVAAAGKAVIDTTKELDRFSAMMKTADMNVVNFADKMSKGQIETTELMKQLNAMRQSGINPTKEQFAALAKAAASMSQKTGVDGVEAFRRLTESIVKGTAEGLIPYGVQLRATSDKHKDQQTALNEISKLYGNLHIELTNNSQRLYALSNNWGTLTSTIWDFVNQGKGPLGTILDFLNEQISDMSSGISSLNVTTKEYIGSLDFMYDSLRINVIELKKFFGVAMEGEIELQRVLENNVLAKFTAGTFGQHMEDLTPEGRAERLKKLAEEVLAKNKTTKPVSVGGAGAKKEGPLTEADAILQAYKTLQGEKDEIIRKNALESQRQWESAEAGRQLLDIALGIEASLDYQISQEQKLEDAENSRLELIKDRVRLLGLETPVNLQSADRPQGLTDAEAASELSRGIYENAAAQVDMLYAQAEELLQAQEEWDKTQAEFQKQINEKQIEYLKIKNEQFEQELRSYGLRQEAIDQVMQLSELERSRTLENIENTYRMVQVTEQLNTAWGVVKGTFRQVADAYEKGTQGMTTAQAVFYYVDAIIGTVSEAAKAAAAAASYDYLSAALHTTAAAGYAATIALAAAHGGASGAGSSGGVANAAAGFSAQSTHTAGRYSGGYSGGQGGNQEVTLLVSMNPTLAAFGAFVDLNDRAARSGDQYFKVAS